MTGIELREAIRALLSSHPAIEIAPVGHAVHAERYITESGQPIAFEPDRIRHQNLWVRADSVRIASLRNIDFVFYDKANFEVSKPNHNLFGEASFNDVNLIRFKVTDLWQAARVIHEVAGEGAAL